MNVARSLPGPLVAQAPPGDPTHAARSAGDEPEGADQTMFGRLLSDLGGKASDRASIAASMDAGSAATGPDTTAVAVRSLADLLSQIVGGSSPPSRYPDAGTRAEAAPTPQVGPVGPTVSIGVGASSTPPVALGTVVENGAERPGMVAARRGGGLPQAADAPVDVVFHDATSGATETAAGATGPADKPADAVRSLRDAAADSRRDEPPEPVDATAPKSLPAGATAAATVQIPPIGAMVVPQAAIMPGGTAGERGTRQTAGPVPVAGRVAVPGKAANGATPATAAPRGEATFGAAATSDVAIGVSPLPQSKAVASDTAADTGAVDASTGVMPKAVVVSQETHLPLAANGPAMQVAVAVKAELAGIVPDSDPAAVHAAEPAAEPTAAGRTLVRTLSIVLTPENLGTVSVDLRLAGGRLELSIVAEHGDTAQAIERDRAALSNALGASGVSVDALVVRTAATDVPLGASGGWSQQSAAHSGGSTASGGGGSNGGTGGDGRQASGSDRRSNGGDAADRRGPRDARGGGLFV